MKEKIEQYLQLHREINEFFKHDPKDVLEWCSLIKGEDPELFSGSKLIGVGVSESGQSLSFQITKKYSYHSGPNPKFDIATDKILNPKFLALKKKQIKEAKDKREKEMAERSLANKKARLEQVAKEYEALKMELGQ